MIPTIKHPAAELLVRKLNEAAASVASYASQLDGMARTLLNERDSGTGLDGFRTAFGEDAEQALECVHGFRELYVGLAGHDVPPLQGQSALDLPPLPETGEQKNHSTKHEDAPAAATPAAVESGSAEPETPPQETPPDLPPTDAAAVVAGEPAEKKGKRGK